MNRRILDLILPLLLLCALTTVHAGAGPQVLVRVGGLEVTADDLQRALASSPFATQFVTMDPDDQAVLRGGLLRRLVASRLLYLEALDRKLDQTPAFQRELEQYRLGLLYRQYMDRLRERIKVPDETLAAMKQQLDGDPAALAAARSAYRAERYRAVRLATLRTLQAQRHVRLHRDRIRPGLLPETLLLEGDGLQITYGDLQDRGGEGPPLTPETIGERVRERAELLLIAQEAERQGIDVSARLERFRQERLPALLLELKEQEWIPDERTLRAWYDTHPEVGRLSERRHVGQLVVSTREQARALRQRIVDGESLYELAGQYSIDPYGRAHNGDMGWIREGRGHPALDEALSHLADGEISPVIETPAGFHIVSILERRPGGSKPFVAVREKVRQLLIAEKLDPWLDQLADRYQVEWRLLGGGDEASVAASGGG
ncbi:MAG TPA: peptidyl-prolyl cis-trans isomerase [Sedimenticola sp.]|nr:peptidyl-prolyl cis-trans isomerase [Sedimenticola sp.]